uniref:Uncharacterized protein n=1 Tax=Columba livia TaxID=8932 RepID=R7VSH5_COLLI
MGAPRDTPSTHGPIWHSWTHPAPTEHPWAHPAPTGPPGTHGVILQLHSTHGCTQRHIQYPQAHLALMDPSCTYRAPMGAATGTPSTHRPTWHLWTHPAPTQHPWVHPEHKDTSSTHGCSHRHTQHPWAHLAPMDSSCTHTAPMGAPSTQEPTAYTKHPQH